MKVKEGDQVTCNERAIVGDYTESVAVISRITPSEILFNGLAIIQYPDKRKFKVPVDKLEKYRPSPMLDECTLTREEFRKVIKENVTPFFYRLNLDKFRAIEADMFGAVDGTNTDF